MAGGLTSLLAGATLRAPDLTPVRAPRVDIAPGFRSAGRSFYIRPMDRRELLKFSLQTGLIALEQPHARAAIDSGSYSPLPAGREVTRFKDAEQHVLSRFRLPIAFSVCAE